MRKSWQTQMIVTCMCMQNKKLTIFFYLLLSLPKFTLCLIWAYCFTQYLIFMFNSISIIPKTTQKLCEMSKIFYLIQNYQWNTLIKTILIIIVFSCLALFELTFYVELVYLQIVYIIILNSLKSYFYSFWLCLISNIYILKNYGFDFQMMLFKIRNNFDRCPEPLQNLLSK